MSGHDPPNTTSTSNENGTGNSSSQPADAVHRTGRSITVVCGDASLTFALQERMTGSALLELVCRLLGIVETDWFGLSAVTISARSLSTSARRRTVSASTSVSSAPVAGSVGPGAVDQPVFHSELLYPEYWLCLEKKLSKQLKLYRNLVKKMRLSVRDGQPFADSSQMQTFDLQSRRDLRSLSTSTMLDESKVAGAGGGTEAVQETVRLRFDIQYYPEDVSEELIMPNSIKFFYQRVNSQIVSGALYCAPEEAVVLAAHALQATYDDLDEELLDALPLDVADWLPKHVLDQFDLGEDHWWTRIRGAYATLTGLSPDAAQLAYLRLAQNLEMYGTQFFSIRNKNGSKLWLGITATGLGVYPVERQLSPQLFFEWKETRAVSARRHRLSIVFESSRNQTPLKVHCMSELEAANVVELCIGNKMRYLRRRHNSQELPFTQQLKRVAACNRAQRDALRSHWLHRVERLKEVSQNQQRELEVLLNERRSLERKLASLQLDFDQCQEALSKSAKAAELLGHRARVREEESQLIEQKSMQLDQELRNAREMAAISDQKCRVFLEQKVQAETLASRLLNESHLQAQQVAALRDDLELARSAEHRARFDLADLQRSMSAVPVPITTNGQPPNVQPHNNVVHPPNSTASPLLPSPLVPTSLQPISLQPALLQPVPLQSAPLQSMPLTPNTPPANNSNGAVGANVLNQTQMGLPSVVLSSVNGLSPPAPSIVDGQPVPSARKTAPDIVPDVLLAGRSNVSTSPRSASVAVPELGSPMLIGTGDGPVAVQPAPAVDCASPSSAGAGFIRSQPLVPPLYAPTGLAIGTSTAIVGSEQMQLNTFYTPVASNANVGCTRPPSTALFNAQSPLLWPNQQGLNPSFPFADTNSMVARQIERERQDYIERSRMLQRQLSELKNEIDSFRLEGKLTNLDRQRQENLEGGHDKYSTLKKATDGSTALRASLFEKL